MNEGSSFCVVITSYGVGNRLERAVKSILEQTLADIEVVVVDDGSDDEETIAVLDRLEGKMAIKRIAGRRGAGAARNYGLASTSRPYVLCLDGDDWVEPNYLEKAQEIFEARPDVGIVSAWVRFEGERHGEWKPENFDLGDLLAANRISSASAFRRAASDAVGGYSEDLGGYEDWDFWIAVSEIGWKPQIIPEVLIHYDWRPGSLGKSSDGRARQLVQDIVSRHKGLYRERIGEILGILLERHFSLEAEACDAWKAGETLASELQEVWSLVGELSEKLTVQGDSLDRMIRELDRTYRRIDELEELAGPAARAGTRTDGS